MAAMGPKRVDGDPVAEFFEGGRQGGRGPPLVVVDGAASGIGIVRGSGGIDQDEDSEVARELAAFGVDVFRRRVAGTQIDAPGR